jgi:hypothetical protein
VYQDSKPFAADRKAFSGAVTRIEKIREGSAAAGSKLIERALGCRHVRRIN